MTLGICSDHAGFEYKAGLIKYLEEKGYKVKDFGTDSPESMDYPDVAHLWLLLLKTTMLMQE